MPRYMGCKAAKSKACFALVLIRLISAIRTIFSQQATPVHETPELCPDDQAVSRDCQEFLEFKRQRHFGEKLGRVLEPAGVIGRRADRFAHLRHFIFADLAE